MSVEEIQTMAALVLIVLASGLGGITIFGFVVAAFFVLEMDE